MINFRPVLFLLIFCLSAFSAYAKPGKIISKATTRSNSISSSSSLLSMESSVSINTVASRREMVASDQAKSVSPLESLKLNLLEISLSFEKDDFDSFINQLQEFNKKLYSYSSNPNTMTFLALSRNVNNLLLKVWDRYSYIEENKIQLINVFADCPVLDILTIRILFSDLSSNFEGEIAQRSKETLTGCPSLFSCISCCVFQKQTRQVKSEQDTGAYVSSKLPRSREILKALERLTMNRSWKNHDLLFRKTLLSFPPDIQGILLGTFLIKQPDLNESQIYNSIQWANNHLPHLERAPVWLGYLMKENIDDYKLSQALNYLKIKTTHQPDPEQTRFRVQLALFIYYHSNNRIDLFDKFIDSVKKGIFSLEESEQIIQMFRFGLKFDKLFPKYWLDRTWTISSLFPGLPMMRRETKVEFQSRHARFKKELMKAIFLEYPDLKFISSFDETEEMSFNEDDAVESE